jgi:hypothetical protein
MRRRGVLRSGNGPVGDYAEILFATAFGWQLEPNSASGHDAIDSRGQRYQIKARRVVEASKSRQLSAIRRLHDEAFDFLAAVLFDSDFQVKKAVLVPHAVVVARARRTDHTNSWTFILSDTVWNEGGVRDVTAEIGAAACKI